MIGRTHSRWFSLPLAITALAAGCKDENTSSDDAADTTAATATDGPTTNATTGATGSESDSADESGSSSDGGLPPIDPDICPQLTFDNVVDEASCPEVQGRGIEPAIADDIELCRRLFLDLTGAAPTADEFASTCEGRSTGEIVDELMATDAYLLTGHRVWADKLRMTSTITYFEYVEQLDLLVDQMLRGEITYPEFGIQVATHPGYAGRFDGQDLVGYNFLAMLGRDAAPHERLDLQGLWFMWEERFVEMHPTYYFGYSPVVVNTITCEYMPWQCHSELWGHHSVIIPWLVPDNYDYEGPNVLPVEDLTDEQWEELRKPGELLVQQPSFYEAAVDDALLRYLGYKAGVEIPLVRQVLVDMLAQSGDLRQIEREIITSQLYRMASEYPDPEGTLEEDGSPDFWHGPMKQMSAELWLDSIEKLTALELGSCDHRFPEVLAGAPTPDAPYELYVWHPNAYPKDPNPAWPAEANKPDYTYRDLARSLGGCPDQESQLRFTGTGVMISLSQSTIAQAVCSQVAADSPMVLPGLVPEDNQPATYEAIADHVHEAITLRPIPDELDEDVADLVAGCQGDAECNAGLLSFHLCSALVGSGDFLFY